MNLGNDLLALGIRDRDVSRLLELNGPEGDFLRACALDDAAMARKLLVSSPKLVQIDAAGFTPLRLAVSNGASTVTQLLINRGADVNVAGTGFRSFPIHWAASMGHAEVVSLLISNGANVNATDINGETALHYLARSDGDNDVVARLLVTAGAGLEARGKSEETPLQADSLLGLVSSHPNLNRTRVRRERRGWRCTLCLR